MSAPARTVVLGREDKRAIAEQLQAYLRTELQQQVGAFEAEFLLDFVAERIGAHYYNRGLHDARTTLAAQMDTLDDALYQLQQPTDARR
ncbi:MULTISPECIES: DUF2164 domain-containing protein [unclassified Xanthomonas]|uniref:DUF2164 domain-containing protein n=1 Tax=unclassified Xanthomonas TaxID=2643310 RepID=UPI0024CA5E2B|nr:MULTISPECIES: DUF2164 domain-containing protein [unclassified Xanthomonas]MDY4298157.1 DUF2164 domain-containing protein [Xanthomonas sp. LF02-5]MDY4359952.1 DUF2164 domain-containing protein [Xanthomonas sp. LF04-12]UYK76707.1 DUF2164 domain-containing protein [Xanthomonas sacchari]